MRKEWGGSFVFIHYSGEKGRTFDYDIWTLDSLRNRRGFALSNDLLV